MSIALFVNPRSRTNRQNPGFVETLWSVLGDAGRVFVPDSLDTLATDARAVAAAPPTLLAIHGGDGSLHKVLTALLAAWQPGQELPPIAILTGGTMNVVAASLGLEADPVRFLTAITAQVRKGDAPETVSRHCLAIGPRWGFVFGNGAIASFLREYYAGGDAYGAARAMLLVTQLVASDPWNGAAARRIAAPYVGRLIVDGRVQPWTSLTAVSAGTVREVGLGYKLNHRADEDPERFSLSAVHARAWGILADTPAVFAGRGLSAEHATSFLARSVLLEPTHPPMEYTIDGDLYLAEGPLSIALGPPLRFVKPSTTLHPSRVED